MGAETERTVSEKHRKKDEKKKNKKHRNLVREQSPRTVSEKDRKLDVQVEIVEDQPDKIPPLVGYFPSGFDPLKQRGADPPSAQVYRHKDKPRRLELAVSPFSGSKVNFVGTNYSGEGACASMCNYAIGILDKETQKLKIVPIASNKIFRLEPRVGASDSVPSTPEKKGLTAAELEEKKIELTRFYSTTRVKKGTERALRLREKEDTSAQPDLERNLEAAIDKEALASASSGSSRNIPPHNLSATKPEDAYPLENIIRKGEWSHLLDIWNLHQVGETIASDRFPTFVHNRVYKLGLIKDASEKKKMASILSFITHLITFKDKFSMDCPSWAKQHNIPSIFYQRFSTMFYEGEKKGMLSPEKISHLISYILVLTLFVDDFETIPEDIAKDLRMDTSTLRMHFENLGCKMVSRSKVAVATLPLPLQFQTMRKKRKGRS